MKFDIVTIFPRMVEATLGPAVQLETRFAAYVGSKHAVAVTAASTTSPMAVGRGW